MPGTLHTSSVNIGGLFALRGGAVCGQGLNHQGRALLQFGIGVEGILYEKMQDMQPRKTGR